MNQPLYKTISPLDRWLITFVVMATTLMEVIDTTIVNVALPHMQGSLSASPDEITWTLTSYMVSSAIFMPLTGYLTDIIGRKKYLIGSIIGFTIASAFCGASTSLREIVFFRLMQGILGAPLVPLSQAILADIFPPEERGKAMAIWGLGVMVGPILGPTLGGYLTDIASWRWTFYVNVPVGIFTLLLSGVVPDTKKIKRHMDWVGLILISLAIGCLQYTLDRGNSADWFNSTSIQITAFIAASSFFFFLLHSFGQKTVPVFDLKIFKDKNFTLASTILAVYCMGMYGLMVIQPLMMEGLFDYPVVTAGLILAPRGLAGMVSMFIAGKLINYVKPRRLILAGIIITTVSVKFGTMYSLMISPFWLIMPLIIQGFGLGLVFVPLTTVAYATLPIKMRTEAAGLYSLLRTIGGSIGISIVITIFTRRAQYFWQQLGSGIQVYNSDLYHYVQGLGVSPESPLGVSVITQQLAHQSNMLSFTNVYTFIMYAFIAMLPLVMLIRVKPGSE